MLGLCIALIVTFCDIGVISQAVPDMRENYLWFLAFLEVLVYFVLVWELTSFCRVEGARYKTLITVEIVTLYI
jgi:hypothetical protein